MPRKPRLIDLFGINKPKRRPFVTQDGTTIAADDALPASCIGESYRIAGEPIAFDERPKPSRASVTFDGSVLQSGSPILKGNTMPKTSTSLDQREMEIVLNFLMSKLSESDMSELDDMLVDNNSTSTAMDARMAPHGRRMADWVRLGPAGRIDARKAQMAADAKREQSREEFHKKFPNARRLSGY